MSVLRSYNWVPLTNKWKNVSKFYRAGYVQNLLQEVKLNPEKGWKWGREHGTRSRIKNKVFLQHGYSISPLILLKKEKSS